MSSRRRFCVDACHAAIYTGALGSLTGCGGSGGATSPSPTGTGAAPPLARLTAMISGNTVTLTIGASSPLAMVGGVALVQAGSNEFLIARTGQATFSVLTAICTHEACTITGFSGSLYVCPCHDSAFDTGGRVVRGPAATALRTFASTFSDNLLVVTL